MAKSLADRLDPEIKEAIKVMVGQPRMDFSNIPAARASSKKMMANVKMPEISGVITEDRKVPGPKDSPDVPVRVYRPGKRTGLLPALLWIHGGGYMFGDLDQEDFIGKQFSLAGDCVVVSVDYRLAPENPYPAPLEDCYAALKWLASHTSELKADHSRIAIGGASAGGGLASGLGLLVRDRAEIDIIYQLLVYPMMNDCNVAPASQILPDTLLWTRQSNLIGWRSYLGCEPGGTGITCYASASRATDLKGLPPTYITVGDLDLFAQESVEYAWRLIEAGVSTELHVYPGGCHAFDMIVPNALISKRFTADMHGALKRSLYA
jgi:acetyl esterase/lipase